MGYEIDNDIYDANGAHISQAPKQKREPSRFGAIALKPITALRKAIAKAHYDFVTPPEVSPPVTVEPSPPYPRHETPPETPPQGMSDI